MRLYQISWLLFLTPLIHAASNPLHLAVDGAGAAFRRSDIRADTLLDYKISWANNQDNVWLHSGQVYFVSESVEYSHPISSSTKELKLVDQNVGNATDSSLGPYTQYKFTWSAGSSTIETEIRNFHEQPVIIFNYHYPEAVKNVSTSGGAKSVSSAWPSFSLKDSKLSELGILSFHDLWDAGTNHVGLKNFKGDTNSGGGSPLVAYDKDLNTVVLSALDNFKVGIQTIQDEELRCGIEGMVKEISADFTHSTILYAGKGVVDTVLGWGRTVLRHHGNDRWSDRHDDVGAKYLSYWTDNGSFYWYNNGNQNYEDIMRGVKKYHEESKIPVKHYQLDSWWYYKDGDSYQGGVVDWISRPEVFPSGIFDLVRDILKTEVTLHNRWWSPKTPYSKIYPFQSQGKYALPVFDHENIDANIFFDFLMARAKTWNCSVYEQDWMIDQFNNMDYTRNNLWAAADWQKAMGRAAKNNGMHIQYCMPLPSDYLQSVQSPAVSQIRVSDDNVPGRTTQYRIGSPSLIAYALGLMPFKDVFLTTHHQIGNSWYQGRGVEPNPELHLITAIMTSGPVGFGDKIGNTNKTLLMRSCNMEGLLLKPDHPAITPDFSFLRVFEGQTLDARLTVAELGEYHTHYLMIVNNTQSFSLHPGQFGRAGSEYVAWTFDAPDEMQWISDEKPLDVVGTAPPSFYYPKKTDYNPQYISHAYYTLSQVSEHGWVLLGEEDKYISASQQRFGELKMTATTMQSVVRGGKGEEINVRVLGPKQASPYRVTCSFGSQTELELECVAEKGCKCAGTELRRFPLRCTLPVVQLEES
ncbi:hypothetical protein PROFUN_02593 [Planoprotostelium fungivorum]|uniref:Uncharacterized protein n=1 Tax=Planoprotostelium fungivorum TaxID=1890364 RepID=A0A2P6MPG3_9EUKA|nr:hypothetical protein PROFUN_02593 [Planoprotostelium fungivorum]